jgi:hypothetical protein
MPNLARSASLGAAVCLAAVLPSSAPASSGAAGSLDQVAALRAQGPTGLTNLLARYDATPPGPARDELALVVDQVAAQRYATVSRLYWYTDLAQAEAAARGSQRPILALRMLGRLDEELSCANSRLFRTTLYANAGVSRFLRENFILYWSSERAVPKVTIELGDGRKIERTTTGNSAHYVLDAHGNVLDVLPGLYAPSIFKDELGKSLQLAKRVRGVDGRTLLAERTAYHRAAIDQRVAAFGKVRGTRYTPGTTLVDPLQRAQRATMGKAMIEMPDLKQIGMTAGTIDEADVAQWATIGQRMWELGAEHHARPHVAPTTLGLFDQQSLALIHRLHTANQVPTTIAFDQVIARLEHSVAADSALNELQLRAQIRGLLVGSRDLRFEPLNAWIYADVFHTPKADAWLGLLPRTDFTGLPGDGVVMP